MNTVNSRNQGDIQAAVNENFGTAACSRIADFAHKIQQVQSSKVLLAYLDHVNPACDGPNHVRQQIALASIRDIAPDHKVVRLTTFRDFRKYRSSVTPMKISIAPRMETPARKSV